MNWNKGVLKLTVTPFSMDLLALNPISRNFNVGEPFRWNPDIAFHILRKRLEIRVFRKVNNGWLYPAKSGRILFGMKKSFRNT